MATATKLIRINEKTRESLDKLNAMYNFSTQGEQLETMVNFFIINKFNPRDLNFNNIESLVNENRDSLAKVFNDNTERIIKIIRNIEVSTIDNINRKTINIEAAVTSIFNDISNKELPNINENEDKNNEKLETVIHKNNEIINQLILEKDNLLREKNEYHRCLEALNMNMKIVNDNGDRKAYFSISIEEVEDLFYLIP